MPQIAVVLVLYRQTPAQSPALQALLGSAAAAAGLLDILVYDNSPEDQASLLPLQTGLRYFHDRHNGRLLAAYTHALQAATEANIPWLMLLDQDTELTATYLDEALRLCSEEHTATCALVPRLLVLGEQRSPHPLSGKPAAELPSGRSAQRLAAWNSGAILFVASLLQGGGFPAGFPLDNLDYATFLLLQQADERVFVMNSRLNHALSVADLRSLSSQRLRGKLAADILLQRRFQQRSRTSLAYEFLRTGLSLLLKLPDKRMGLLCLRSSVSCLLTP